MFPSGILRAAQRWKPRNSTEMEAPRKEKQGKTSTRRQTNGTSREEEVKTAIQDKRKEHRLGNPEVCLGWVEDVVSMFPSGIFRAAQRWKPQGKRSKGRLQHEGRRMGHREENEEAPLARAGNMSSLLHTCTHARRHGPSIQPLLTLSLSLSLSLSDSLVRTPTTTPQTYPWLWKNGTGDEGPEERKGR